MKPPKKEAFVYFAATEQWSENNLAHVDIARRGNFYPHAELQQVGIPPGVYISHKIRPGVYILHQN